MEQTRWIKDTVEQTRWNIELTPVLEQPQGLLVGCSLCRPARHRLLSCKHAVHSFLQPHVLLTVSVAGRTSTIRPKFEWMHVSFSLYSNCPSIEQGKCSKNCTLVCVVQLINTHTHTHEFLLTLCVLIIRFTFHEYVTARAQCS